MGAMLWRHRPKGVLQQAKAQQPAIISWEAHQEALFNQARTYEAQLTALRETYEARIQGIEESVTSPVQQTEQRQPKRK
ncbi:MAG: hypothetical protein ABFD89_17655 [Bryobacteraceae bacterium]